MASRPRHSPGPGRTAMGYGKDRRDGRGAFVSVCPDQESSKVDDQHTSEWTRRDPGCISFKLQSRKGAGQNMVVKVVITAKNDGNGLKIPSNSRRLIAYGAFKLSVS
jgi:hypothetical protein